MNNDYGYSFVGRIVVERRADDIEVLERKMLTTCPLYDSEWEDDLQEYVFDKSDVPTRLGVYAIMYTGCISFITDSYTLEVDIGDVEASLLFVYIMDDKEVIQYFDAHNYDSSDYHEEVTGGLL